MDPFCYLCFMFVFVVLSCLFLAAFRSPAGKGMTSYFSCMRCFLVFCHIPIWCPRLRGYLIVSIPDLCPLH